MALQLLAKRMKWRERVDVAIPESEDVLLGTFHHMSNGSMLLTVADRSWAYAIIASMSFSRTKCAIQISVFLGRILLLILPIATVARTMLSDPLSVRQASQCLA